MLHRLSEEGEKIQEREGEKERKEKGERTCSISMIF